MRGVIQGMKIELFEKDGYLDNRSLGGGVYRVDILSIDKPGSIPLYIGEAGCIVKRCGMHLMKFTNNPEYFGLTKEDTNNPNLILRFSVEKTIEQIKEGNQDKRYIEAEKNVKAKIKPILQVSSQNSDRMISIEKKRKVLHEERKKLGF